MLAVMDAAKPFAVDFDFTAKTHRRIDIGEVDRAIEADHFVWVDLDISELRAHGPLLDSLGIPEDLIEDAREAEVGTQHARYPNCLHMVLAGCQLRGDDFDLHRVDAVIGNGFLLTLHTGKVEFLERVKHDYPEDFEHHARSPSFLIYELWDHLLDKYVQVQDQFETHVERMQARLIGDVDESVFTEIAELGADLLHFRKVLLPARSVLTDLATRKSRFISEATQPFLANMVGTVERVLQDLLVDREILSDSLNLHLSAVSHRTNAIMSRLTVVSVVFLPLTFLVGVYGMNFDRQPELHWRYGYPIFWGVVIAMTVGLLVLLNRKKLL